MKQNYIGFADSEGFLAAIDRSRPVNLNVSQKWGKAGRFGVALNSILMHLSQVQADEALYFEMVVYRWQQVGGQPLMQDEHKPARLADQALMAARQWLTDHNVSYRQALLSMPASYITMDGDATFLRWDKEFDGYRYIQPEPA